MATPLLARLGAKWALVLGFSVYCLYVSSFVLARELPASKRWGTAMSGAVLGGLGAGIVWPSQGAYFAASAAASARFAAEDQAAAGHSANPEDLARRASGRFSAMFATLFLSGEIVLKLLSSVMQACPTLPPTASHAQGGRHTRTRTPLPPR